MHHVYFSLQESVTDFLKHDKIHLVGVEIKPQSKSLCTKTRGQKQLVPGFQFNAIISDIFTAEILTANRGPYTVSVVRLN